MKTVAGLAALLLASVCAYADDKEDLAKAAKKAQSMDSYSFKSTIEVEGIPQVSGPMEFEGKNQKDVALHVSGSMMGQDFEAYKKGDKVATNRNGNWQLAGGGGRNNGRGGGFGGGMSRNIKAPHEELADLEKKFKEVKKSDKKDKAGDKDCTIYTGDLTDEAAKNALPMGGGMGQLGGAEISGKAKVWVDDDGVIRKYSFESNIKVSFNGQDLEITTTRTTEFSKVGETKVELPDEVKKLFEDKKEDNKDGDKKDGDKKDN